MNETMNNYNNEVPSGKGNALITTVGGRKGIGQTSQEVTHPGFGLSVARLTLEFPLTPQPIHQKAPHVIRFKDHFLYSTTILFPFSMDPVHSCHKGGSISWIALFSWWLHLMDSPFLLPTLKWGVTGPPASVWFILEQHLLEGVRH
ncbi:hypothetical protein CFOL_v3_28704 [Cephalotus follicularis]|uniref:Uncharacterized protein n=1 Tax=Cephalotus follicularis TaxID=3775 RepID=A0A1Q3CYE3_CEPFO|nr:hypothetical protein CFOL_v3_28704 [Cephalotus follicularis]